MHSQPIIRVIPFQPHCFAFGGFEVQMIAAMESARAAGANIAPLDFWSRDADFDVLHFWGLEPQHVNTVKWAHAAGKRTVLTALVRYPGWVSWLRHMASIVVGPSRLLKSMLVQLDCITVVNESQAQYLVSIIGFPAEKISIVPNAVDEIFYSQSAKEAICGLSDYIICVGNVCQRKNQLALVRACIKLEIPLLLVGRTVPGEEPYAKAVADALGHRPTLHWIREGLPPGSSQLAAAYHHAAVFALPSFAEQQPISALEAAASGKPLVLADRAYARQEFYHGAVLTDPASVNSIAAALRQALEQPARHIPPVAIIEQCRRAVVGADYMNIYKRIAERPRHTAESPAV